MRIYVASSWRNPYQPDVVSDLRRWGHEVYDFRNPAAGNEGFHWSEIDGGWQTWNVEAYRQALRHPVAERGFAFDMDALRWCEGVVLVMPAGRSSHLELGWAAGAGRRTAVFYPKAAPGMPVMVEPELMAKMADAIVVGAVELVRWADGGAPVVVAPAASMSAPMSNQAKNYAPDLAAKEDAPEFDSAGPAPGRRG